jgi:hypothetical protein
MANIGSSMGIACPAGRTARRPLASSRAGITPPVNGTTASDPASPMSVIVARRAINPCWATVIGPSAPLPALATGPRCPGSSVEHT